ncbi:methyl farnesoate epoxidase [Anabrus simplex]|uniref:methyl farnesoate epoxidase n=1 Tax=Anabrus simplex TaxID=316456 RepID=UPI0035A3A48B
MFWILLIIVIILYLLLAWITMRPQNFPPGPPYLPVIGSAPFLQSKNFHFLMEKWRSQYGPVVGIFLGRQPAIAVCEPSTVLEVLKREEFQGRPDNESLRERSLGKHLGIMFNDGPAWAEQRRFTLRHLKEFGFGKTSMESLIIEEVHDLLEAVGNKTLQVSGLFNISSVNVLWGVMAGMRYKRDDPELRNLLDNLTKLFRAGNVTGATLRVIFPFLKRIAPSLVDDGTTKTFHQLHHFIRKIIQEHKKVLDENLPRDFIDAYLIEMLKQPPENSSFSEDMLVIICMDLFAAGAESVGNTLSFALLYMVLHPEVQEKVQKEIDHQIGRGRLPSLQDKSSLQYTEAVLMEIQRINSIAPLTVPHRATRDTELKGYFIPKDTFVTVSIWSLLQDKSFWHDPTSFRPERFLDSSGKISRQEWFLPFGVGKRLCPGEAFARNMLFLVFTSLLQKYSVTLPPGHLKPSTLPLPGFTTAPQPFEVTFISR